MKTSANFNPKSVKLKNRLKHANKYYKITKKLNQVTKLSYSYTSNLSTLLLVKEFQHAKIDLMKKLIMVYTKNLYFPNKLFSYPSI